MKLFTSTILTLATVTILAKAATEICVPLVFAEDGLRLIAETALDAVVCEPLAIRSNERHRCDLFAQDKIDPRTLRACGTLVEGAPEGTTAPAANPGFDPLELCIPVTFHSPENYKATLGSMKSYICDLMAPGPGKDNCNRFVAGQVVEASIEACGYLKR